MKGWHGSFLVGLVSLALTTLALVPARATSQVLLSVEAHARASHVVVRATVGKAEVSLHPEWKRPVTRTTLLVRQVLLGDAPSTLVVEQLGGRWGDATLTIPGDAHLTEGQEVVVFLAMRMGSWRFTAMEQSCYRVERDADGPKLRRDLTSAFFQPGPSGVLQRVDDVRDTDLLLAELERTLDDIEQGEGR